MRIISWNMSYWSRPKTHHEAWNQLLKLKPDVALVQEAVLPDEIVSQYDPPFTQARKAQRWGSAIVSRIGAVSLIWDNPDRGPVQVANLTLPGLGQVTVANIHSRLDSNGRVIPNLEKTFTAVRRRLGTRYIVGGDFNTARSLAIAYPARYGHGEFWANVDGEWGFKEALPYGLGERQSYWGHWHNNRAPSLGNTLQDDHVLMDEATYGHVSKCRVWDTRRVRELSDHGPIVVDLKLPF